MNKSNVKKNSLTKLVPYLKKQKGAFAALVFFLVLNVCASFVMTIFSAKSLASFADLKLNKAFKFVLITLCVAVIFVLAKWLFQILWNRIKYKQTQLLRHDFIVATHNCQTAQFDKLNTGVFIERCLTDINKCNSVIITIIDTIFDIVANIGFFIYLAFLNIYLFLVLVVYVVIRFILEQKRIQTGFNYSKIAKKANEIAIGAYGEQIRANRDVKNLNIKENVIKSADDKQEDVLKIDYKRATSWFSLTAISSMVLYIFEFTIFTLGIVLVDEGLLVLATFLIFQNYSGKAIQVLIHITTFKEQVSEGNLAAERIFEVIENFPKEKFGTEQLNNFSGRIQFKNVVFGYSKDKSILKNLSLEINPNETTAIVGESGTGKTTILSLINKLYTVERGKILLDEKDISLLSENAIRDNIGVVTQDPYIFNVSIYDNMKYVKPNATKKEIVDCLKKAQIYDIFKKEQTGLNTLIGENGKQLSGGQKQRLAIARLLLKNPKVIVFDEATSALDNVNQNKIVKTLKSFDDKHTIIIVAHRLSTIINADKIIFLEDGKLKAQGTHKELLETCEGYKNLYEKEDI